MVEVDVRNGMQSAGSLAGCSCRKDAMKNKYIEGNSSRKISLRALVILVAVLILSAGILLIVFRENIFYERRDFEVRDFSPSEEMVSGLSEKGYIPSYMFSRCKNLLISGTNTQPYAASWYLLPGQLSNSMPAMQSEYMETTDQVLLMRLYVLIGDRAAAAKMANAIEKDFTAENGYLVGYREISGMKDLAFETNEELEILVAPSGFSFEATSMYLRALLEYYSRWGTQIDWDRIERLADLIASEDGLFPYDRILNPSRISDPMVGLTEYEEYFEDELSASENSYRAVMLSSFDLEGFRMLADADETYLPMYEAAIELVSGGYISDTMPLYSLAYSDDAGGYVNFVGEDPKVELIPSLKTMLNLAYVDALPLESVLWIKKQVYNTGYFYTSYDIISGMASSDKEAWEAYGLVLQIAAITGDTDLYVQTADRLRRNLATLDSSPAKFMVFRRVNSDRNMVVAQDNFQTLLGMLLQA
jgi:hypothetical protein